MTASERPDALEEAEARAAAFAAAPAVGGVAPDAGASPDRPLPGPVAAPGPAPAVAGAPLGPRPRPAPETPGGPAAEDVAGDVAGDPAGDVPDDPERRFRTWPKVMRRWTPTLFWRRLRLPVRRRRWRAENAAAVAPYAKPRRPDPSGPAIAIGDFSGRSGLSRAALYELERLRAELGEVAVLDIADAAPLPPGPAFGRVFLLSAPDTYARALPLVGRDRIATAHRTGLWVWETPRFPTDWRFALDVVHEVWTPSEYSRAALASGAGAVPVTLRPHAVSPPEAIAPLDRAAWGIAEDAFLGLAIMDVCSCPFRKNPWAHVAAWQAAFGADPARVLLLKIRVSKRTRPVLDELAEMIGDARNIRVVEGELEAPVIAGLQRDADVYLSLHRAEGYGLNIRECLGFGTPVVATDYSANAEYGPAFPNYRGLPWRPVPYRDWTGHYPDRDFTWAEVSIAAARDALRAVEAEWRADPAGRPGR